MAEYIEREAAVKAAQEGADEWDGGFNRNRDAYIECAIDKVPAADVRERVPVENVMEYRHVKYDPDEFFHHKKPTNADRIRKMSDEELARFRAYGDCPENRYMNDYECDYFHGDCEKCWLDWLQQEATE